MGLTSAEGQKLECFKWQANNIFWKSNKTRHKMKLYWYFIYRDRTTASTLCCFCLFFPLIWTCKKSADYGPNNTKNSSKSVIFSWITLSESCVYCKKPPNLIKKLFLCFVSKPRVGPINSKHNNFKWGNRHLHSSLISMILSHPDFPFVYARYLWTRIYSWMF